MLKKYVLSSLTFLLSFCSLLSQPYGSGDPTLIFLLRERGQPTSFLALYDDDVDPEQLFLDQQRQRQYQRRPGVEFIRAGANGTTLELIDPQYYYQISLDREPGPVEIVEIGPPPPPSSPERTDREEYKLEDLDDDRGNPIHPPVAKRRCYPGNREQEATGSKKEEEVDSDEPMDEADDADAYGDDAPYYYIYDDDADDIDEYDDADVLIPGDNLSGSDEEDDEDAEASDEDDEDEELSDLDILGNLFNPAFWVEHLTEIRQRFDRWSLGDDFFRLLLIHHLEDSAEGGQVYVFTLYYLQSFFNDPAHEITFADHAYAQAIQNLLQADPRRPGHNIQETYQALDVALNEFVRLRLQFCRDEATHPLRDALSTLIQAQLRLVFTLTCDNQFAQGLPGFHAARVALSQLFYLLDSIHVFEHVLKGDIEVPNNILRQLLELVLERQQASQAENDAPLAHVCYHLGQAMYSNALAVLRDCIARQLNLERTIRGDEVSVFRLRCIKLKREDPLVCTLLRKKAKKELEAKNLLLVKRTIAKKPRSKSTRQRLLRTPSMIEESNHKRDAMGDRQRRRTHFNEARTHAYFFGNQGESDTDTESSASGDTIPIADEG